MMGFEMHNSAYRITVQWRYWVYMKGERGPFQTSITINVQNLVVTSPDETKVLRWDPVRGIAETSFSYSLKCAQKKECDVCITIHSTDGMKVYEKWLKQIAPESYNFTWDGSMNVRQPLYDFTWDERMNVEQPQSPPAPAGLYVFDIKVNYNKDDYDRDRLRSNALWIGKHEVVPVSQNMVEAKYILYSGRDASDAWIDVWALVSLSHVAGPVHGPTHAIPENTLPKEHDYNITQVYVSTDVSRNYAFLF